MIAKDWMSTRGGWQDDAEGWAAYLHHLIALGLNEAEQKQQGFEGLSRGWAIGTKGWRQALAKDYSHLRLSGGLERAESKSLNEGYWEMRLAEFLRHMGKQPDELQTRPKKQVWKVELAQRLRREAGASIVWIARTLRMGQPGSVRSYLARASRSGSGSVTARGSGDSI